MAGKIRNYYAGGNTARGFFSLFESNLQGLDRMFILKGGPGTGKSSLMKSIGKACLEQGFDVEYIHCSSDNDSIDGVLIPALKVGIVDGTAPHIIEPKAPGAIEEYVNLGSAWDSQKLAERKRDILQITSQISASFQKAYSLFGEALKIHDEWEKIYIENMDFAKVNELTQELTQEFFSDVSLDKKSDIRHRFLGAATPKGAVDYIQNLTEDVADRYFIKGRPGSGKSTMLKKLASAAEQRGFDIEVYHCGFDPNSLDMVLIRELGIAIFDSTAPHEYFPDREGDRIIDVYERAIAPDTDDRYAEQLLEIKQRYSNKMKDATSFLAKAKDLHDHLENIYIDAMNFAKVTEMKEEILSEIDRLAQRVSAK